MSPLTTLLLEILRYTIPAVIVLIAVYLVVQKFLLNDIQRKQTALFHETQSATLPLRLQAYERLAIFAERISPRQLLPRIYHPDMNVAVLQHLLSESINAEFEHNLSQQIYVSRQVWETVKNVREQELGMIRMITEQLKPDAPAKELVSRINDYALSSDNEPPTAVALQIISEEARRVLSYGPAA